MINDQNVGTNYFAGGSNMGRMICANKLYEQGRNYLTAEEIRAIAYGKLGEYLNKFLAPEEPKESRFLDAENSNYDVENLTKKVAYNPKTTELMPDEQPPYAVVQLNFEDFVALMKLKIAYQ